MIEGLKFDVKSEELQEHLRRKVLHHRERAAFYEEKAQALQDGEAEPAGFTGGDPIRALREKGAQHQNRVELFEFLQLHLIPGETYRLEEGDLLKLEIISRGSHW